MKVFELIAALQDMPQNADVMKHDCEWGYFEVGMPQLEPSEIEVNAGFFDPKRIVKGPIVIL